MIKKILFTIATLIAFATPALSEVNAVATLPWIGSIAREIGKDKVNVTVLVKPNQDPHFVEARPSMIVAASKADIIMFNGLDLEVGYLPLIINSSRNHRIQPGEKGNLNCSKYINAIERPRADIDRSMGDVHPLGNPHYHLSPSNMARVAEGITDTLTELDSGNAAFYRANLASFNKKLEAKRMEWEGQLRDKRFVAFHKYFEYLADDFGFRITGYIEPKPGISPSSGQIARLTASLAKERPDAMLTTSYYGKKEVAFISAKTGIRGIVVPHEVGSRSDINDWFSLMDSVIESLK
ncbi:MAG: zinc ABC transporter substrate-binding protein [Deltaproteobacteria bacterium]|nr:zinc ABC transporter substrate-binding protein [Deltaproteobacteria bacterium]